MGIIPARYSSTRFPGKVLANINNKTMIQWVYERANLAQKIDQLYIATDDERVMTKVKEFTFLWKDR